jgi:hypothetical protein
LHDDLIHGRRPTWLFSAHKLAWLFLDAIPTGNAVEVATYAWHEDGWCTSVCSVICNLPCSVGEVGAR